MPHNSVPGEFKFLCKNHYEKDIASSQKDENLKNKAEQVVKKSTCMSVCVCVCVHVCVCVCVCMYALRILTSVNMVSLTAEGT